MKIFTSDQIKNADRFTIENEPITSSALMERAGSRLVEEVLDIFPNTQDFTIFAGPGNNGGDGLVMARLLQEKNKTVQVVLLDTGSLSPELTLNIDRWTSIGNDINYIRHTEDINNIDCTEESLFVDALFGIGLNRPLDGLAQELVQYINQQPNFKLAVDVPSGLSAEADHLSSLTNTIIAQLTLSIQFPKLAFFFAENEIFVGSWKLIDINLSSTFILNEPTNYFLLDEISIRDIIKPRDSFAHKGTFGHALIIAGSKGKIGASILSGEAALKTGCGLLTMQIPSSGVEAMHSSLPEAMVIADSHADKITDKVNDTTRYNAIGFGPGIDKHKETSDVLKLVIQNASQPLIIDADGLNILSENLTWIQFLNGSTILTPHPGEFDRLTHKHVSGIERFKTQLEFSKKNGVYMILKGHHTSITTPSGMAFFNTTGNNGMATGGSGDVLTGIITSLCAQGYSPLHACLLGVYLHGYAGDCAAAVESKTSMIASDIIEHIPDFFLAFEK